MSAALFRADTGEQVTGSGGKHYYILVNGAGDIERFLRNLDDRRRLDGLGWHLIGNARQLLDRSLVDRIVVYSERLCFEGAPIIEPPLAQDPSKCVPEAFEGGTIDTRLVVPRLMEYERHRVGKAKTASAEALGKAAGVRPFGRRGGCRGSRGLRSIDWRDADRPTGRRQFWTL